MSAFHDELIKNANLLCTPGKGFLAADESTGTIGKRFAPIGLENNEENRIRYRELLFTTKQEYEKFISGVIFYEETLFQNTTDGGIPFVKVLQDRGVLIGIKLDKGVVPILGTDGETATQGLDGLGDRIDKFYAQGARFAKWRNVIKISDTCPSELAVQDCAFSLARYASICQQHGLVPIIEPEVLMDGNHSIDKCAQVTERVLAAVFKACSDHHVLLEGAVLKPNMVTCGAEFEKQDTPQQIAEKTLQTFQRTVPVALPGIFFLSGGQSEEQATINLNAINALDTKRPWHVSFSYGRALQASCIKGWNGKDENKEKAQQIWFDRASRNSQAQFGKLQGASSVGNESLYEKDYKY